MKISLAWLTDWVKNIPDNITDRLTMAGLEVEAITQAAPNFSGVVVGQVIDLKLHPDADKLRIALVDVGQKNALQIVCGASNIVLNMKVAVATVGAMLPNNFKIQASFLRGIESFGMLCSSKELGLSEESTGLISLDHALLNGQDLREALHLNDTIIEIDLTPNRGDCLSMLGVAREIAAITNQSLQRKMLFVSPVTLEDSKQIHVENTKDCPRYLGRYVKNIDPNQRTPLWMSERLRRAGIRSHGILVDITNYILIELGQPLHAFDAKKVEGDIFVRRAKQNESLILLNESAVNLETNTLLVCDAKKILAIAGIMGSKSSSCSGDTTEIFLESAWFNPLIIAGKARHYGLQTDASHRYERGVDFELAHQALESASQLLIELTGASVGPICSAESLLEIPKRNAIKVYFARVNKILGMNLSPQLIFDLLSRVGTINDRTDAYLTLQVPSYRFDLAIEEDLIEEVARLNGYDNIPVKRALSSLKMLNVLENITPLMRLKEILIARSYIEVITMSFVKPSNQSILEPDLQPIVLKNPISADLSVMRSSLLPGLLSTIDYNFKRQQKRIRIFESGLTFRGDLNNLQQSAYLGGAVCGDALSAEWGSLARKVDFFDIKGDVEALLLLSGKHHEYYFERSINSALHPGMSADIMDASGNIVGFVGALHPSIQKQLDLDTEVFVFECLIESITQSLLPQFCEVPKFPSSKRDIALLIPDEVNYSQVIEIIRKSNSVLLHDVQLFDIYKDASLGNYTLSMAFSLSFQNLEENLIDSEIDVIISQILKDLRLINVILR